jgi:transcriptional regulator with GAF, ATPase, and Fis domain
MSAQMGRSVGHSGCHFGQAICYASDMAKQIDEVQGVQPFFGLVSDISSLLVGARSKEIEKALDDCLAKLGEYFDVQHVALGQISSSGELLPSLRMWGDVAAIDFLAADPPGPEMVAYFIRNGSLTWNCLEDLDELPQWREHCRQVGALNGSMWLHRDFGSHVEGMAMSGLTPKVWPEDTVDCLRVVGQVLFNAFYRRRAEAEAEHAQQLEHAIAETAATLVRVRADDVDAEINDALGKIGATADADLCVFLRCNNPDELTYTANYEWNVDAADGPVFSGVRLDDDYPWLVRQLKKKRPLSLSNPDDFALEAKAERELFERFGIRSMHWEPFEVAHGRCGYIGLGTVNRVPQWPDGVLSQLGLFGNIVADAMDRQRTDIALEQAFKEIRVLKDRFMAENETLRQEVDVLTVDRELVGKSPAFRATQFQAEQVAPTDSTVLLLGQTGTGKGLIARKIHELSSRSQRPLITVNCAALPGSLIESELFGHEKGAFTGAITQKIGRFELADHGTIFLDEVGDLPTELQAKLLRVLQDQEFERLGSSTTRTVDVRVIAATNRDLDLLIEQGEFRADLYYRLGVFPVRVPALRERRSDIPLLVWFFISELQHRLGKEINEVSAQAMAALFAYDWPGNVRELKNIIERAMILSRSPILRIDDWFPGESEPANISVLSLQRNGETIEEVERAHIEKVLAACDWRIRGKDGAAEHLGLKRTTLQSRMKKLGIVRPTT